MCLCVFGRGKRGGGGGGGIRLEGGKGGKGKLEETMEWFAGTSDGLRHVVGPRT